MAGSKKLEGKHLQDALKLLNTIGDILDEIGIRYSLDAGTLLGVMRENRLLPWDTDMDLTISAEYVNKIPALIKKIRKAGYITRLRKTAHNISCITKGSPRLIKIYTKRWGFFKDERVMDIFIKYKQDGFYYWAVDAKQHILQSCPQDVLDELIPHEFNHHRHWIPKAWDAYLQRHYGDWRVVRKEWDWHKDDLCNLNKETEA